MSQAGGRDECGQERYTTQSRARVCGARRDYASIRQQRSDVSQQRVASEANMKGELPNLDATEQAELVRRKEVSPLELVDAAVTRIEKVNPQLTLSSRRCSTRRLRTRR